MLPPWKMLRNARRAAGLTQAQAAQKAGITQGAVAQLERPGSNPTVETLASALTATGHRLKLGYEPHVSSVDETLIARNLRMTPAQRVATFETAYAEVARLRGLIHLDVN